MKADNILVVNGKTYAKSIENLGNMVFNFDKFLREPKTFKLVLFTGGEDVDPSFYGETSPRGFCHSNILRDRKERLVFKRALRENIKMTGICRGIQFLNVMAGGKLLHHIDGHAMWGVHDFACSKDSVIRKVNSLHHQMVIPPPHGYIIGWCPTKLSEYYVGDKDRIVRWPGPEVESLYLPRIKACGVQWHPEMMSPNSDGFKFYNEMVADFLDMSTKEFSNKYTGREKEKKTRAGFIKL